MDNSKDNYKHYFVPGELMVMVEHSNRDNAGTEIRSFMNVLNKYASEKSGEIRLPQNDNEEYLAIRTFKHSAKKRFISTAKVVIRSGQEIDLTEAVIDWMNTYREIFPPDDSPPDRVLTPNWLAIPTPVPSMDGGPGGPPVRVPDEKPIWKPFGGEIVKQIKKHQSASCEVDVFVLDTIPEQKQIEWAETEPLKKNHEIWRQLRQQLVTINFPPSNSLKTLDSSEGDGHDYEMPDHGLFIAGTIAMLAPNANIHLVEVLNNHGVGTLESVLEGLQYVITHMKSDRNTVVNCSFMMSIPLTNMQLSHPLHKMVKDFFKDNVLYSNDHIADDNAASVKGKGTYKRFEPKPEIEDWLVRPLLAALEAVHQQSEAESLKDKFKTLADSSKVLVFAAAGNNGKGGKHPPAMYPAAYQPIFGVGAFDKNKSKDNNKSKKMAEYSNIADTPVTDGFLTFGGLPGEEGMLGIYLHKTFPNDPSENENGWARWSGTSFATGVMSGLIAALLCCKVPSDVLDTLYRLVDEEPDNPQAVNITQNSE